MPYSSPEGDTEEQLLGHMCQKRAPCEGVPLLGCDCLHVEYPCLAQEVLLTFPVLSKNTSLLGEEDWRPQRREVYSLRKPEESRFFPEAAYGKEMRPGSALGQGHIRALALTIVMDLYLPLYLGLLATPHSPFSPTRSNNLKQQSPWALKPQGGQELRGIQNLRERDV